MLAPRTVGAGPRQGRVLIRIGRPCRGAALARARLKLYRIIVAVRLKNLRTRETAPGVLPLLQSCAA